MGPRWWLAVGVCGLLMCMIVETKSGECIQPTVKFDNITRRCHLCRPGHRMIEHCTKRRNTRCAPCSEGTYLESSNKCRTCRYCNECDGPGLTTVQSCTATSPSICGCLPGYERVFPGADWCQPLPKCPKGQFRDGSECKAHTWCKKGQGVVHRGTPDADTICQRCPDGTFSRRESPKAQCQSQPVCVGKPKIQGTRKRKTVCSQYATLPTTTMAVFTTASSDNNGTGNDTQGFRLDRPKLWLPTEMPDEATQRPPLNIKVPVTLSNGEEDKIRTERIFMTMQGNISKRATTPAARGNDTIGTSQPEDDSGVEQEIARTTVAHQPSPGVGLSYNDNETIIVTIIICGTIAVVSFFLAATVIFIWQSKQNGSKQVVDQVPLTAIGNSQERTRPTRLPIGRQDLYVGNNDNQSSSSAGDENDSRDGARPVTSHQYIPKNARLKPKGENDSTSSSSPGDERKNGLPKRRKKPSTSGASNLRAAQHDDAGPSHEGQSPSVLAPPPPPQQQQREAAVCQQQQPQPAVVQEESRESTHRSHLVTSGHVTPPESGHRTTHCIRDMVVQDSESGVDSPSSGDVLSEGTSEDERQRPSENGGEGRPSDDNGATGRASDNNLLSAEDEANLPNQDSTGATENGACGGTSNAGFLNGVNVETKEPEVPAAAAASSGEDNIPCYQLADGVNFEADIISLIANGLDSWRYLLFLKHLGHPKDEIDANSTIHDYVFNFLCTWWQHHHAIGAILMALKKSGNERLRDEIIQKFCELG